MQGEQLQHFVVDKLDDLKGQDILTIDVKGKSSITDCLIICTGTSNRHVLALADNLAQATKSAGISPLAIDSDKEAEWIIVDLGEIIVHVMQEEPRQRYQLEKLWG